TGHWSPGRDVGVQRQWDTGLQGGALPGLLLACLTLSSPRQVSKAAADLLAYCEAHAKEDPLVTPVPSSENPFREKRLFCIVL
uniref:Guanine nucleotide-binding protein subunit gamma n=1 Tax=Chelonoidis abingdonii TaxID=106734 RepID=A0A8C0HAC5_CHEAB